MTVEPGHRAIIFDLLRDGVLPDVYGEGTHFLIPVVQKPIIFDVRAKPRNIAVVTGTKGTVAHDFRVQSSFSFMQAGITDILNFIV